MADDITLTSSEPDIAALKATLAAQQNLLQKLYNDLDAEREASASAASEALSVILRLQGEKAAVKMEAEQYKRLSEQKMSHVEESLAIIENIIYQKEMEISALDCQVQAYRYKLLSMGCLDFGDNPLQGNETGCDRADYNSIDSYWEQLRKLDVRVNLLQHVDYPSSPSVHDVFEVPQIDRDSSSWEPRGKDENETAKKDNVVVHPEAVEEPDWLKKVLKSKQMCEPSYDTSIECRLAVSDPTTSVSECRLNGISEIIEVERPVEPTNREGELKLLNEIKEGLNWLHEEIRCLKVKKMLKRDEPSLCALSEAMLYFWL
ncbi:hypothetical protein PHJA_002813000 [Phtheirospermum japonicum]|uniref:GTD-binding domain-containing protein n=1 Tax=Phtheirospermum japonicum TaxID=374723 RepID=A0A830D5Z1_9LAMI|nr:hypothetical protein PHJA_002813000 [Phtheirospermum japonicum]